MAGATPRRTCVGCRRTTEVTHLHRVALADDGTLVVDRSAPGRGAWLCRVADSEELQASCLELAWRRQGFQRAFRRPVEAQRLPRFTEGTAEMRQCHGRR